MTTVIAVSIEVLAGAVALAAVASGVYIGWVYRQRREEALFLTRLVYRDIRVSAASAVILGVIVIALYGQVQENEIAPDRLVLSAIITFAVCLMMYGPISDALLWRRERRYQHRRDLGQVRLHGPARDRETAGRSIDPPGSIEDRK